MSKTVSARALMSILIYANRIKAGAGSILPQVGLPLDLSSDLEQRYSSDFFYELLKAAADWTQDPHFGFHLAKEEDIQRFDIVSYVASTSSTLGEGLQQFRKYIRIWNEGMDVSPKFEILKIALRFEPAYSPKIKPGHPGVRHYYELALTTIIVMCRQFTGMDLNPLKITFNTPKMEPDEELQQFFGAPIDYQANHTKLVFKLSDMRIPLKGSNSQLSSILNRYAEELLAKVPNSLDTWSNRVFRELILRIGKGEVSIDKIARHLGMSGRSLQRRLKEEQTSFLDVLKQARVELAKSYLQSERLSLTEIAYLLGFSDTSAFYRAFKQLTGKTPSELKAELTLNEGNATSKQRTQPHQ